MATTVQTILTRALDRYVENRGTSVQPSDPVVIWRVGQDERAIYRRVIQDNRYFTLERVTVNSTAGASAREIDTAALTPPVGRTLRLERQSDGAEIAFVDATNVNAELAPRALIDTKKVIEIGSDWSSASGAVAFTLMYLSLPVALNTAGALTQTVTLPDEWCELLDNRFAAYLARKDVGRSDVDIAALDKEYEDLYAAMRDTLAEPEVVRRFVKPDPRPDTV